MTMRTIPSRLYKYQPYSAQSLTALKVRTLWFGPPSGLNDPFDCAVPLRFKPVTSGDCARLIEAKPIWRAKAQSNLEYFDADGVPTETFRAAVERAGINAMRELMDNSYRERGVTCFSETHDNLLLWSHYGAGHRGFCLEFNTQAPGLGKFHPVQYSASPPEIDLINALLGDEREILSGLLTKSECWTYEREWRAIHKVAGTLYCYGVEGLSGVFLGAGLKDDEVDVIAHLLTGTPTRLYRMQRSELTFGLDTYSIEYSPYRHPPLSG